MALLPFVFENSGIKKKKKKGKEKGKLHFLLFKSLPCPGYMKGLKQAILLPKVYPTGRSDRGDIPCPWFQAVLLEP